MTIDDELRRMDAVKREHERISAWRGRVGLHSFDYSLDGKEIHSLHGEYLEIATDLLGRISADGVGKGWIIQVPSGSEVFVSRSDVVRELNLHPDWGKVNGHQWRKNESALNAAGEKLRNAGAREVGTVPMGSPVLLIDQGQICIAGTVGSVQEFTSAAVGHLLPQQPASPRPQPSISFTGGFFGLLGGVVVGLVLTLILGLVFWLLGIDDDTTVAWTVALLLFSGCSLTGLVLGAKN